MLREPTLLASHDRGDAKRKTLFPEQCIATVTGAEGPYFLGLWVMDDIFVLLAARPAHILLAGSERRSDRMDAGYEMPASAQDLPHRFRHARHDVHADHHVRRVGQLDADMRDVRAERPHRERNHIQGPAAHAAVEELAQRRAHLPWIDPVVGGARIFLSLRADERAVFGARHVVGIREREERIWTKLGVEPLQHSRPDHLLAKPVVFFPRAVAPLNPGRFGQRGKARDPFLDAMVLDVSRSADINGGSVGLIHPWGLAITTWQHVSRGCWS